VQIKNPFPPPVHIDLAHSQHDVARFGIELQPGLAPSIGGRVRPHEDLEIAVLGNWDIVEVNVAEHGHFIIAPEACHGLDRRPVRALGIAPDAIGMRTVEKGVVIEEIGVLRAPGQLEGHEERLGVERRVLPARRNIHVECHRLQGAEEIVPLRQKSGILGMAVREQIAACPGNGCVPLRLCFSHGRWR
jgi:hypothetical protein